MVVCPGGVASKAALASVAAHEHAQGSHRFTCTSRCRRPNGFDFSALFFTSLPSWGASVAGERCFCSAESSQLDLRRFFNPAEIDFRMLTLSRRLRRCVIDLLLTPLAIDRRLVRAPSVDLPP